MNAPHNLDPRRRLRQLLLEHLDARLVGASAHIQAFMRAVSARQAEFYVALLTHYGQAVAAGESPMLSKPEWARRFEVSVTTLKDWWQHMRRWTIEGRPVFAEGVHAFRRGTVVRVETKGKKTRRIVVAPPGICARSSADPAFPLYAAQEIVESTLAATAVAGQNLQGATAVSLAANDASADGARRAGAAAQLLRQLAMPFDRASGQD